MKRTLSFLMSLAIIISCVLCGCSGEDNRISEEGFLIDDYGVLTHYTGTDATVIVPRGVRKIGYAFDSSNVVTAILPESVTTIGDMAFQNSTALADIKIPDSVLLSLIHI